MPLRGGEMMTIQISHSVEITLIAAALLLFGFYVMVRITRN